MDYNANQIRKSGNTGRTSKLILMGLVLVVVLIAGLGVRHFLRSDIREAQARIYGNTGMTYGEIINGALSRARWSNFISDRGERVVEVTGRTSNGDSVLIQIADVISPLPSQRGWQIVYMEINGRQLSDNETTNWMRNAANR